MQLRKSLSKGMRLTSRKGILISLGFVFEHAKACQAFIEKE